MRPSNIHNSCDLRGESRERSARRNKKDEEVCGQNKAGAELTGKSRGESQL